MSIRRTVRLLLDKAAARKVERDLKAQSRRVKAEQKRTWKEIGRFVVAAFGVRALARFTKEMFKLGSAAEETGSKFRTVFGSETAAELDVFIEKFGALAGLTKTEGRDMLAIAGTIGQGVGLAGPAVAAFAGEIVELAADLQSFHDVPIAETFMAIRSGVTGEAEQLKKFGIILRAVDVDQRALANSGKAIAKDLTETERVTARLQLITEKAGVAVGDLARTQDSTANTARRLETVFRQLKETLALSVLPAFSLIINGWADISSGAEGAVDVIGKVGRGLTAFVARIQIVSVHLNAFFRSIPARLTIFAAKSLETLIAVFVKPAELLVNRIRSIFGKEAIDFTAGLSGVAERLRTKAEIDIVAWRKLIEEETAAILKAAEIVDEATGGGIVAAPSDPGADPATIAAQREADRRAQIRREESAVAQREADEQDRLSVLTQEAHAKARADAEAGLAELQAKATRTGEAMTSAFDTFFAASRGGFADAGGVWAAAGQAAREGGAAIVEGLIAGRAQEQMAQGVAALASGIWPPNPAALLAAGKHFAAAALFRAIPGAIAGGGGGGSGGGAGAPLPRGALGSSAPGSAQPPGPEINIFIDPLSPADPDFQRVVLGAGQSAKERFGENVNVNIHPRTGGR